MAKKAGKAKGKKGEKTKGKKGNDKKAADKKEVAKEEPVPEVPKINPCIIECPVYYILDVSKRLRTEKYNDRFGPNDEFLYFKDPQEYMEFFSEIQAARERKRLLHDACIDQIVAEFTDPILA